VKKRKEKENNQGEYQNVRRIYEGLEKNVHQESVFAWYCNSNKMYQNSDAYDTHRRTRNAYHSYE
jgi:hypothetical protein